MEPNPYQSPEGIDASGTSPTQGLLVARGIPGRDWCACVGAVLCLHVPGLLAWEQLFGLPAIGRELVTEIVVTMTCFLLTLLSVPRGYVGLRSRYGMWGVLALVLGSAMSWLIFTIKFAPVLGY